MPNQKKKKQTKVKTKKETTTPQTVHKPVKTSTERFEGKSW
jgi:hypothetical protein